MSQKGPLVRILCCIALITALIKLSSLQTVTSVVVSNKMRYATSDRTAASGSSEQVLEYAASNIRSVEKPMIGREDSYRFRVNQLRGKEKFLDDEDKSLLEKFYRETKERDPFIRESLNTQDLWNEQDSNSMNSLIDLKEPKQGKTSAKEAAKVELSDWTIEPDYLVEAKGEFASTSDRMAKYEPNLRLLTTYNPVEKTSGNGSGAKTVGATLFGQDQKTMPKVDSKSAVDAIKLHDELFKEPPRDGKVRVRMYYHWAIHDDARLYGNGPWKYWGHGWGVEFGYDPMKKDIDNFYQRGYTIEKMFGRDFCKDKQNCRKPDPNFFKEPRKVGHYTRESLKV